MRRQFLQLGAALAAQTALPAWAAAPSMPKLPRLVLSGPYAAVSNPFFHMIETGALKDVAEVVEFKPWKDPDHLRALALDTKLEPHIVAMPTNVAANLYNRGVRLQLMNVSTWGVLWMVSRDGTLKTLADFKGKEIVMPFRADMPDIVFQTLAEKQGLNVRKDFAMRYVGSPIDAMQLLLTRQADHAVLAEPAVSVALRKTKSFPLSVVAPELHRSVDFQQEWGRTLNRKARLPQAGITALGSLLERPEVLARVQQSYATSLAWCEKHPDDCGRMVASKVDMLSAEGVADSIRVDNSVFVSAADARAELEFFLTTLMERQPALVGNKLPDAAFYYNAK